MTRREAVFACAAAFPALASETRLRGGVALRRVPEDGIQPQAAVGPNGRLHLVYYTGDPARGNLSYAASLDGGATFSSPLRVNSQAGSAIATGTIRGAQVSLGQSGHVHAAWNGSSLATPKGPINPDSGKAGEPMLYSRLARSGNAFEPQRNLMRHTFGLDGGGSVAADPRGNVYVAWHGIGESEASGTGLAGEARRRVWIAQSHDDGGSFASEVPAWTRNTGACGCCGMKIFADSRGVLYGLYRSATEGVHRDIYLLISSDHGRTFQGRRLHTWDINACPMSSMDLAGNADMVVGAWETGGQIYWTRVDSRAPSTPPAAAPGASKLRKHPRLAINAAGEMLLAWTEGTGWRKGGTLAYQVYDRHGTPTGEPVQAPGIPAWSFPAVAAAPGGGFVVIY